MIVLFRFLCNLIMVACAAHQSSTKLPPIISPRKFLHPTIYQRKMTTMSCRKRLLSEQNDRSTSSMKYPDGDDDDDAINKRTKKGNFVILMSMQGANDKNDDC